MQLGLEEGWRVTRLESPLRSLRQRAAHGLNSLSRTQHWRIYFFVNQGYFNHRYNNYMLCQLSNQLNIIISLYFFYSLISHDISLDRKHINLTIYQKIDDNTCGLGVRLCSFSGAHCQSHVSISAIRIKAVSEIYQSPRREQKQNQTAGGWGGSKQTNRKQTINSRWQQWLQQQQY